MADDDSDSLFFPSILAGPGFTMADYQRFTAKELKDAQGGPSAGRRRSGLKRFVVGAFFMAFYGLLAGKFSYTRMADASFAKQSLLYRCVRLPRHQQDDS